MTTLYFFCWQERFFFFFFFDNNFLVTTMFNILLTASGYKYHESRLRRKKNDIFIAFCFSHNLNYVISSNPQKWFGSKMVISHSLSPFGTLNNKKQKSNYLWL